MSMWLKGWGHNGVSPDFDAFESGMDIFINWQKDFVGKSQANHKKQRTNKIW